MCMDEKRIIKKIQSGDKEAFRDLLEIYEHRVYGFVKKLVYNAHIAEDITQETFISVYRSIHTYKSDKPLSTWLFTIAKNAALKTIKKSKQINSINLDEHEIVDDNCDVLKQLIVEEDRLFLLENINKLKIIHQEVIILKYFNEMSYKDISKELNISVKKVENRLASSKKALGKLLLSKERLVNIYE